MRSMRLAIASGILLLLPALHVHLGAAAVLPVRDTACTGVSCLNDVEISLIDDLTRRGRGRKGGGNGSPGGSTNSPVVEDGGYSGSKGPPAGMTYGFGEPPKMTKGSETPCLVHSRKRGCKSSKQTDGTAQQGINPVTVPGQTGPQTAPVPDDARRPPAQNAPQTSPQTAPPEPPKFADGEVEKARTDGKRYLEDLNGVSGGDAGKTDSLDTNYFRSQDPFTSHDVWEGGTYLKNFNVDNTANTWKRTTVTNKPTPDKMDMPEILRSYENFDRNKNEGTIMILESKNKDNDDIPKDDPRKMSWSDMTMDNWRNYCGSNTAELKNLKYMARDDITTPETRTIIDRAVEHTNGDRAVMNTFKYDAQGPERESFDAIVGSVHGSRVALMLKDHHNALGNLKIRAFHVIIEKRGTQDRYDMVIEFGH